MKTRPSALCILELTCGPLIYDFVDETLEQVNYRILFMSRNLKNGEGEGETFGK